ncbi:MAG: hypothetical protein ACRDJO_08340 [Actinomycetota bacterium]
MGASLRGDRTGGDRVPAPGTRARSRPDASRPDPPPAASLQTAIVRLQRTIGNTAVGHLLRGDGPGLTVQRARLNIRSSGGAQGTISGVSQWPSRPASNLRSGQGQHLTAYVAFEQMILSRVRDLTPEGAAASLIEVAREIKGLPAMVPPGQFNNHIHLGLDLVIAALSKLRGQDPGTVAAGVGPQIDEILRLRNQVPGTAISIPGTKGHGEAGDSGSLEVIETGLRTGTKAWDDSVATQAVQTMWFLFDYDPPAPGDAVILESIAKRVLTHVLSMRMAFPAIWRWLSGKDEKFHLLPYLIAHAGGAGLPLPRLGKLQLGKIKDHVYARL